MRKQYLLATFALFGFLLAKAQQHPIADNASSISYTVPSDYVEGLNYASKRIIFKLKAGNETALSQGTALSLYLSQIGASPILLFPQARKPERQYDAYGRKLADLTRIYKADYSQNIPVLEVMEALKNMGIMEYVQPNLYVKPDAEDKIQFTPNDPSLASQWHISTIQAELAWDFTTGSSSVIIGLPDGGTNLSHTDLQNIAFNPLDPIDGTDNDGDGWIDNYQGWNTGSNNNNPQFDVGGGANHGVAVCGIAGATVNNAIFGVGIGYNCPYLPIKIVDASNQWSGAEPGVFYAAEKGAKVINCSWGGTSPWPLIEDVTRYAVINKGCLVVGSAGNTNNSALFWPAAYEWVTCVAGTQAGDLKSTNSSFYDFVDICAPGQNIFSTSNYGFGNVGGGTSWAGPIVASSAALVFSYFPAYTAEQVNARLKETSFNVYSIPGNAPYLGKLGRGRVNVGAALNNTPGPSINMISRNWTDGNNEVFSPGDTVSLSGNFINWLNPSSPALSCTLSSNNPNVVIIDSIVNIGVLNNMAMYNNSANPFRVFISPSCPENTNVLFKLSFSDFFYTDRQYFSLDIHPNFLNITENTVHTSISSNGRIGYADPGANFGLGLSKNGALQHLAASSFVLADSPTRVSDATISATVNPFTADFNSLIPATKLPVAEIADFDAYGMFADDNAGANKLDVQSRYKVWAWDDPGFEKFVIVEYTLTNTGGSSLTNLFSGIYSFWEMPNGQFYNLNYIADWDASRNMGFARNANNPLGSFAGVKLLSYGPASWYAFNNNGAGGSINLFDGFTEAEKYTAISNGVSRPTAIPGTISGLLGTGPLQIASGDSVKVAFAILLGDDLADLQAAADSAQVKYDQLHVTWTGNISSDWNDAGNWFPNHVPNACTTDVTIPLMANQPHISGADFTVGNLSTAQGVVIDIDNAQRLNVCKNILADTGTGLTLSGGRLALVGSQNQKISGKVLTSMLRLENSLGAEVLNGANLHIDTGIETVSGTLVSNSNLRLLSNTSGTAYINDFSGGFTGNVSGSIQVERFNPIGIAGFRQLGTPVMLTNISSLSGFTPNGTAGFVIPEPSCDPNYVAFNSPYGNWMQLVEDAIPQFACAQSLFQVLLSGGMTNGRGYYLDVPGNSTLVFNGLANSGNVSYGLTHVNGSISNGWNMVANPYPSPLAWEMGNVPPGIDAIGKVWMSSGAYMGTFQDLDPNIPGTAVAIGQAFQVRVSAPFSSPQFSVDNADRTILPATYLFAGGPQQTLYIDITGNGFADMSKIRFMSQSSELYDAQFDSYKVPGNAGQPMIYSIMNNENYSTNSIPGIAADYHIPLGIKTGTAGTFNLEFSNIDQFDPGSFFYLEDTHTGTWQNLLQDESYELNLAAGKHDGRLILHFYAPVKSAVTASNCMQTGTLKLCETGPANWVYELKNTLNQTIAQGNLNDSIQITGLAPAQYYLSLSDSEGFFNISDTIVITGSTPVSANPTASILVAAQGENVQFTANAQFADQYLWQFGDGSSSTLQNPNHSYMGEGTYIVSLNVSNTGCSSNYSFNIQVSNANISSTQTDGLLVWSDAENINLQFDGTWKGKLNISLIDLSGKIVLKHLLEDGKGLVSIPAVDVAGGIYVLKIQSVDKQIERKIHLAIK